MTQIAALENLTSEQISQILKQRQAQEKAEAAKKRDGYEKLKEYTVVNLSEKALQLNELLADFKKQVFGDLNTFYEVLKEYSSRHNKAEKGGFTLKSADQQFKIKFTRHDIGYFDERSDEAERHINDFINQQFPNSDKTKKLIVTLLERKKGQLDVKLVQKLYSMENDFDNESWRKGIQLLKESWQCSDSRDYVVFYIRDKNGNYQQVDLNFSSL